jgi:hypothetical protein
MVIIDIDTMGSSIGFESSFGLDGLVRGNPSLKVNVAESTCVIDEYSSSSVSFLGKFSLELRNKSLCRRFQLVYRDTVAWICH